MRFLIAIALLIGLLIFGCAGGESPQTAPPASQPTPESVQTNVSQPQTIFPPGYSQEEKVGQSAYYWHGIAQPFAILGHSRHSDGTVESDVKVDGTMNIILQNTGRSKLTLAGITAVFLHPDGNTVAQPKGLPITFKPGEVKGVDFTHNKKDAVVGAYYEVMLEFTYKDQNGTEMKQIGSKPLVGKYW